MEKENLDFLTPLFDSLEIKSAQDEICNFEKDYQIYLGRRDDYQAKLIADQLKKVLNIDDLKFEKDENGKYIMTEEYMEIMTEVIHKDDFRILPDSVAPESWKVITDGDYTKVNNHSILEFFKRTVF